MPQNQNERSNERQSYQPERKTCLKCGQILKRSHIGWRKMLIFPTGTKQVTSWVYRCADPDCEAAAQNHISQEAEKLHLKHRRYSRELIVKIGYRRFWHHRTMYEIYDWLRQELNLGVSKRQVLNLLADFLALLRAGQPAKVQQQLSNVTGLIIGIDGMQPEKGNKSLYIVREPRLGLTLMAENLDEGSNEVLSQQLLDPLKAQAKALGLSWQGVVSDAWL